jgi:methionyl-tRNA formyltransferase
LRVLFWGTPEFALPSLRALLGEGHDVVGVVTQPDRPAGRGRVLQSPPAKILARDERLPVFQPPKPVGDEFLAAVRALHPELSVVVAYGEILRREVLDVPEHGSINVHASLLPALRGAAPIQWAIAHGHEFSGVTIMRMVEKMDAGPILMQVAEPIAPEETGTDLAARLSELGAEVLIEALALMEAGVHTETPQDDQLATFAGRIKREDAHIDWTLDADSVERRIRAFDAVPGAWTTLDGTELKLFRPRVDEEARPAEEPGTVVETREIDPAFGMRVACGSGSIWIREVQPPGRRRMTTAAWLHGRSLSEHARLA